MASPASGTSRDHGGVGGFDDVEFCLANANGLDQDDILARCVHQLDHIFSRGRQSSMTVFRRHTADEHAGIEVMLLHADAIAQDGAARERAGRVGGDDANGEALLAQDGGQSVDECAFATPRRAGDTNGICLAKVGKELLHDAPAPPARRVRP